MSAFSRRATDSSTGAADENIKVGVSLTMGVSASGIPLSPATLLMPYYTRYLDPDYVAALSSARQGSTPALSTSVIDGPSSGSG
jgi:hypothetical protein